MSIIPQQEIKNIIATIDAIPDCNTLIIYEKMLIKRFIAQLQQTLASSAFFAELATIPTDLASAIQWITNFINKYLLGPYDQLLLLEAELLADYVQIIAAIENKLSLITCASPVNIGMPSMGSSVMGTSLFGG